MKNAWRHHGWSTDRVNPGREGYFYFQMARLCSDDTFTDRRIEHWLHLLTQSCCSPVTAATAQSLCLSLSLFYTHLHISSVSFLKTPTELICHFLPALIIGGASICSSCIGFAGFLWATQKISVFTARYGGFGLFVVFRQLDVMCRLFTQHPREF